eukprot:TRINITY_DN1167_c0_g2_i1.p1 TRINITY_DN1167_c0_g2~~TRINITY_DN1167_c0_g2_i1.p1  ORF type:complete len:339 (+),score=73.95 TRINITY_DN1167_c0_g2_i1:101-1117(+)
MNFYYYPVPVPVPAFHGAGGFMPGFEYGYYNNGSTYPAVTPPPTPKVPDFERPSPPPSPPPATRSSVADSDTWVATPRSAVAESGFGDDCGQPKAKFPEGVKMQDLHMWGYSTDIPMPTLPFMNDGEGVITVPKKKQIEIVKGKCIHCNRLVQPGIVRCTCKQKAVGEEDENKDRKNLINKLFRNLNQQDLDLHAELLSTMEGDKNLLVDKCVSEIQNLVATQSQGQDHELDESSCSSSCDTDISREHLLIQLIGTLHSKSVLTTHTVSTIASILLTAAQASIQAGDRSPEALSILLKLLDFAVLEASVYRQLLQIVPNVSTGLAFRIERVCGAWDME